MRFKACLHISFIWVLPRVIKSILAQSRGVLWCFSNYSILIYSLVLKTVFPVAVRMIKKTLGNYKGNSHARSRIRAHTRERSVVSFDR